MLILGISAYYHDSAAAILRDGRIVAAAQEERFTRKKHDPGFPVHAARFCLEQAGATLGEVDAVVFYDKPFLKFERLLETYHAYAPRGLRSFCSAMPVWIKEKLSLRALLIHELNRIEKGAIGRDKLLFSEHHLSHAASAFYASPFSDAAVLTIDGVGEWATASIFHGQGASLKVLSELRFPHSLGLLYSSFTQFLGFKVNSGEYKLMGLAPYGNPESADFARFKKIILEEVCEVAEDGSVWLNQELFEYSTGLQMVNQAKWERLFGMSARQPESEFTSAQADLALAIQDVTELAVLRMAKEARRLSGSANLCLAGGVALNCVANGKLLGSGIFERIWIQPAAGDAGGALGAALAAHHIYFGQSRQPLADHELDAMQGSFLGPEYGDMDIERMARFHRATYTRLERFEEVADRVAEALDRGCVVGWFQGRAEWGPRSLGNRSILADARDAGMQKKLNLKIKYRESFRPFAPSVLAEAAADYFELSTYSPYMLSVAFVNRKLRRDLPLDYSGMEPRQKLAFERSTLPSVTHLDFTARVQTVHGSTNPRFAELLKAFQKRTNVPVLINTSFNVRGEPIVLTPDDAYRCFMRTEMDYLVLGNYLFDKALQPAWKESGDWQAQFGLD